jgi:hypothetical protein
MILMNIAQKVQAIRGGGEGMILLGYKTAENIGSQTCVCNRVQRGLFRAQSAGSFLRVSDSVGSCGPGLCTRCYWCCSSREHIGEPLTYRQLF